MMKRFHEALSSLSLKGLLRQRRTIEGPQGPVMVVDGVPLLSFASNDYLGLANHPALIQAAHEALDRFGVGAAASALISGHSSAVHALEAALAEWLGYERALHFSTGYMANTGIIPALVGEGAAVFSDALNHACLIDGIRLSSSPSVHVYRHGDLAHLEQLLQKSPAAEKWIITDGVFSMDGDMAAMVDLVALAERFDAQILVDDAHGLGVLGLEGRGTLSHLGVVSPRIVYMATLGKAAGVFGAFVAGPKDVIDWLEQRARTYMFSTGSPPALAAAALASIECMRVDEFRREHLRALGRQLQQGLDRGQTPIRGLTPLPSQTAIHPILVGDNASVMRISAALQARGIWVPAIRPPTVPEGQARLRISLSAAHSTDQVEQLITALRALA